MRRSVRYSNNGVVYNKNTHITKRAVRKFRFDNKLENKLRVSVLTTVLGGRAFTAITYHWLNYEKGADSTIVSSRAARFRNTM
ncbi:hypothetical protein D917_10464, partial [Trichinella nativa]